MSGNCKQVEKQYRQVSFYGRDMFLKNVMHSNTKFPFKTVYYLGVRGLTASSCIV